MVAGFCQYFSCPSLCQTKHENPHGRGFSYPRLHRILAWPLAFFLWCMLPSWEEYIVFASYLSYWCITINLWTTQFISLVQSKKCQIYIQSDICCDLYLLSFWRLLLGPKKNMTNSINEYSIKKQRIFNIGIGLLKKIFLRVHYVFDNELHFLNWTIKTNELFHCILMYWNAPVYSRRSCGFTTTCMLKGFLEMYSWICHVLV